MVKTGTSQPYISIARKDLINYIKKSSHFFNYDITLDKTIYDSWQLGICIGGSEHFNPMIKKINQDDCVLCLSCSYDGSLFTTGSADSLIRLFDANTFRQLLLLSGMYNIIINRYICVYFLLII
jgi:WD40 repeat protein